VGAPTPMAGTGQELIDNIRYGYALGWSFTPLSGKKPTRNGWQTADRETVEEAIEWAKRQNVGLRTGLVSGIVVIDVDAGGDISKLELPGTVTVNTGKNGIHLYYRCSVAIRNSVGKLGPHIDVRGDGGQVVYPGSVHPDTGRRYEWAEGFEPWTVEIAELPEHIIQTLTAPHRKPHKPRRATNAGPTNRYTVVAVERELKAVIDAAEGTRNATLNTAAFNLGQLVGGGYLQEDAIRAQLAEAAAATGLTEGEANATITSGLKAGIEQPRRIEARPTQSQTPVPGSGRPGRYPYVLTPGPHVTEHAEYVEQGSDDFARDVLAELPVDAIYRKDYIAGELLGEAGNRRWIEFSQNRMLLIVDEHCKLGKWVKSRKNDERIMVFQPCSKGNAGIVIAQAQQDERVRDLRLMVSYPVYGPGWKRLEPGWKDGLYYDEPPDLQGLSPETDCEVIHNVLHDLVIDFPFKAEADRQNFFGLLLTPIISPAIDGNRPLHLMMASLERTGKTKLAEEVLGGVILGRQTPAMQITERDEERDKRVIGLLLQGETIVHLDNLPTFIDSGALASLLTATTYGGRLLGGNRMVNLPNNLTLVASGNNVTASGELVKRSVPIVLQPTTAHPERRRDFQHPDLRGYVRKNRRTVLECLLGLVENWIAAGRPIHADRMGGFEGWSGSVGGILQVNGLKTWRTNEQEWREQADPRGSELAAFATIWFQTYGSMEVRPKELLQLAQDNELFAELFASKRTPQAVGATFGKYLRKHTDMPVEQWVIRARRVGSHSYYLLEELVP